MKLYSLLILFSIFFLTIKGDDPINYLGVKAPLKFNKNSFNLVWSAKPKENYYIHEYIPKGEDVEHFNEMLTLNLFITDISLDVAVQQKANELNNRKATDEVCNFSVTESPDGKDKVLDCILSVKKDDKLDVVEFIIYHYKQVQLANNRKGLVIYSYSKRSYGDTITKFLTELKTKRTLLLNEMIATEVPKVSIR